MSIAQRDTELGRISSDPKESGGGAQDGASGARLRPRGRAGPCSLGFGGGRLLRRRRCDRRCGGSEEFAFEVPRHHGSDQQPRQLHDRTHLRLAPVYLKRPVGDQVGLAPVTSSHFPNIPRQGRARGVASRGSTCEEEGEKYHGGPWPRYVNTPGLFTSGTDARLSACLSALSARLP